MQQRGLVCTWFENGLGAYLKSVHGHGLQLIHDPRPHLYQPMPQQLPQILIFHTRYPQPRKAILQQSVSFGVPSISCGNPDSSAKIGVCHRHLLLEICLN